MTNRETLEAREGQVDEQQQWLDEINVALGPDSIQIVSNDDRLQRIRQLKERLEAAEREAGRLSELLWGSRCVFCGKVVGAERKNQEIADETLREHVRNCPEHPLRDALDQAERWKSKCAEER